MIHSINKINIKKSTLYWLGGSALILLIALFLTQLELDKKQVIDFLCSSHVKEVKIWLEKGGNPDEYLDGANTPLTILGSPKCDYSSEIVSILVSAGASVNKKNKYGYSPLFIAALNCNQKAIQIFIKKGEDINSITTKKYDAITLCGYGLTRQQTISYVSFIKSVGLKIDETYTNKKYFKDWYLAKKYPDIHNLIKQNTITRQDMQ